MTTYVAFLRAINLGKHLSIRMEALRGFFASVGFEGIETVQQTGNVVFRAPRQPTGALEQRLEGEALRRHRWATDFLVRDADELERVLRSNPFPEAASSDPSHLLVYFLKDAPRPAAVAALQAWIPGRESVRSVGRALYAVYPDGIGRSRLSTDRIERTLAGRATGRNWNTVGRCGQVARSESP
ncbi:MAG TPA: DUF1697 domain-containing protein [Thermoplasmata archaeon]|nr:DUF1697 domain-containing protein [Thermoplasmata archaeon]